MTLHHLITSLQTYKISEKDICQSYFNCEPDVIQPKVVLAPNWDPSQFNTVWPNQEVVMPNRIWTIHTQHSKFTYIKTGIGAPCLGDVALALGMKIISCQEVLFIGSAGALKSNISIGDLLIPTQSICGDGFSRYITSKTLTENNPFGEITQPNPLILERILQMTERIVQDYQNRHSINIHQGLIFSTDTILAQFAHFDEILKLGCIAIEMETAALFKVMELANIQAGALLVVSDNIISNKSLFSGRTEEDRLRRREIRQKLLPEIITSIFEG